MKTKYFIFLMAFTSFILFSCNNDKTKQGSTNNTDQTIETDKEVEVKPIENNIYNRVEATSELAILKNILDSLQLKNKLIFEEGPFTIFGVKDEVFQSFLTSDSLYAAISENETEWKTIINTYILDEQLSSVDIYKKIKKNDGVFHAKTNSGKHLKFYLIENDIIVEGPKGLTSKIGKSDILGENGTLHIIDNLLGVH